MSRVGRKEIEIPDGVTVKIEGVTATVTGPKGELVRALPAGCRYEQEGNAVRVSRETESIRSRCMHGLARTLLHNMVLGVTQGFSKDLEIVGVGFKAELKGREVVLTVGLSFPHAFRIPDGITIELPTPTQIKVSGMSKELVGQVAAEIRGVRPPEPYKGKGVKYAGEFIQRKAGKTAAGT
jgi:large subunit ribosomal protein L6